MNAFAARMLDQEARALLTRLARLQHFALLEPMLPAASLLPAAQIAIERHLVRGRRDLERSVQQFLRWLNRVWRVVNPAQAQRRFVYLRLQFNAALTQFDLFSDVITQRSEHDSGVWMSGLDFVATDALTLPGGFYEIPPIICYLDRGAGAAIRRARTRLPGGGANPVAIIRVPRERMIGSGIASSLVHEVGHQGSALLDLVGSVRPVLQAMQRVDGPDRAAWRLWERWIGEILADFWAIARVGIASTHGLMGVVSLPHAFVFRIEEQDPHPAPWLRVLLSCAIGDALYPHAQWSRFASLWVSLYPLRGVDIVQARLIGRLRATMPALVVLLIQHRPRALRGRSLGSVLMTEARGPRQLARTYREWTDAPQAMYDAAPSLVFAVIGQARADGRITPELESELLGRLLTHWACAGTLGEAAKQLRASNHQSH